MTVATIWLINFAKISSNGGKKVKQEVTKFGSHSLSGFRVAAKTLVVWDKNSLPVGNVKREAQNSDACDCQ